MEQARITIIGAGPAGLSLGLALAKHKVKSIILEKEIEITEDPRGVYLAGDAVRILYDLGLGDDMPKIGQELDLVEFCQSSFVNPPFHTIKASKDSLQQAVATGIMQVQPALETALREKTIASGFCDLRVGCDVLALEEDSSGVIIKYHDIINGRAKDLHTSWLIGADGKKGVVRKDFLEPTADIRQVHSDYQYEGTWIAANLRISLPMKETFPNFPPWKVGMTPDEVYDLFWPKAWQFCCPPGKPTASGRFGPQSQRWWRHEFRQDVWDEEKMNAEELFWEHLTPMISRTTNSKGEKFSSVAIYPRECIEVVRCRSFTFAHKVANKWFHHRSILIGDAAHVFPPFGGQGIASGIRDAHQLAWRLAVFESIPSVSDTQVERMLSDWQAERALSVKQAAQLTKMNGTLCNYDSVMFFKVSQIMERIWRFFSGGEPLDPLTTAERNGVKGISGFFLKEHGGGVRLPQIYVDTLYERQVLSDTVFGPNDTPLRLLVIVDSNKTPDASLKKLHDLLDKTKIPPCILSQESIVIASVQPCRPESLGHFSDSTVRKMSPTPLNRLNKSQARAGYDVAAFESRLGKQARFAILRPDFYVFAVAKNLEQLEVCLIDLRERLR